MSHTMKIWERVIELRLRQETHVIENQFGFMLGRKRFTYYEDWWKDIREIKNVCI